MPHDSLFLRTNISWILSCNAIDKLIDALFRMKDKMAGIADGMEINFGTFLLRDVILSTERNVPQSLLPSSR